MERITIKYRDQGKDPETLTVEKFEGLWSGTARFLNHEKANETRANVATVTTYGRDDDE